METPLQDPDRPPPRGRALAIAFIVAARPKPPVTSGYKVEIDNSWTILSGLAKVRLLLSKCFLLFLLAAGFCRADGKIFWEFQLPHLTTFKETLTPERMREDIVFQPARDPTPYRERKWEW